MNYKDKLKARFTNCSGDCGCCTSEVDCLELWLSKSISLDKIKECIKNNLDFIKNTTYGESYKTGYIEAYEDFMNEIVRSI